MTANVELIDPKKIQPNEDNPRLIFRLSELEELEQSIASQGILVPLTLFKDGSKYVLLDGERRWRCATKLGLHKVPAIVQPKPHRIQNIMMMFAIHNARKDWDPLPTARKLLELENELSAARGRRITESELSAASSLSRGAIRRYRKIQRIPGDIQERLLRDLERPNSKDTLSVDQVIEAVDAAESLSATKLIEKKEERGLIDAVMEKFTSKVIKSTVEPRKIIAVSRAVQRGDVSLKKAVNEIRKFVSVPERSIDELVASTIESVERSRAVERVIASFEDKVVQRFEEDAELVAEFRDRIQLLIQRLRSLL